MKRKNRNQLALNYLKELGFPLINIRQALPKLIGIEHKDIGRIIGESRGNVTHHLNGIRATSETQEKIARVMLVSRESLFDRKIDAAEIQLQNQTAHRRSR